MKKIKRISSMLLALVIVFCLGATAFAEENEETKEEASSSKLTITVQNVPGTSSVSIVGKTFSAYKVFDYESTAGYTISDKTGEGESLADNPWFTAVMSYMGYTKVDGEWCKAADTTTNDGATAATSPYSGKGITLTEVTGTGDDTSSETEPASYEESDAAKTYSVTMTTKSADADAESGDDTVDDAEPASDETGAEEVEYYEVEDFAAYLVAWVNENTTVSASASAEGTAQDSTSDGNTVAVTMETAVIDVADYGEGYYLVTVGSGGSEETSATQELVTLMTVEDGNTGDNVVSMKTSTPTVDKEIVEGENGTTTNDAKVGDIVSYKVTSSVPDMTGYKKYYFVVKDTLSEGLTFGYDIVVKVGEEELEGLYVKTETVDGEKKTQYSTNGTTWVDSIDALENTTGEGASAVSEGDGSENGGTGKSEGDFEYVVYTPGNGGSTFELVFNDFYTKYHDQKGTAIEVTYSAKINENALVGSTGNTNDVTLTYSNDPSTEGDGDNDGNENPWRPSASGNPPVSETPASTTYTYVTAIELIKVDTDGNRLSGATFTLTGNGVTSVLVRTEVFETSDKGTYWKLKDGSYTETAPVYADGVTYESKKYYKYDSENEKYDEYTGEVENYTGDPELYCKVKTETGETATVDEGGSNAEYVLYTGYLYESLTTKYSKTEKAEVKNSSTENVSLEGTVGADGVLRFEGLSAGTYTITETKAPEGYTAVSPITVVITCDLPEEESTSMECNWTYTVNGKTYDASSEDGILEITVVNSKTGTIPETGGIGTTIFYIVGSVLVAGAAILLIAKKRMGGPEE